MEGYSVLMSVYVRERPEFLKKSIESMLAQTAGTDDFVIVCDGPLTAELDETLDMYENMYPEIIHIIRLPENGGLGTALNHGMKCCRNDLVARMDSDDISFPDRCEKQLRVFEKKEVGIVGGIVQEFVGEPENVLASRISPETAEEIRSFSKRRNPFNHPAVMFRKRAVEAAGGYRHFPWFEDYYLWVRMLADGVEGYNIQEPLVHMRAGADMYARRGGLEYVKSMMAFKGELRRMKYLNTGEYLISALPHIAVGLMPNGMRELFYKKLLRR